MVSGLLHSSAYSIARRGLLRIGTGGVACAGLPCAVSAEDTAGQPLLPQADHCIVLFLNGGPSHLDMWDMKPEAPLEIRGEFSPISSSIPGIPLSEHLPQLARQLHRTALIRSMHHSVNNSHAAAVYAALTGHDRGEQGGGARPTDNPSPGSVVAKLRPAKNQTLPYISLPYKTKEGAGGPLQPGFLAGFMGPTFDPFWVLNNPDAADFHVDNLALPQSVNQQRMTDRSQLLAGLGRGLRSNEPSLTAIDDFQHRAFELLTGDAAQRAFNLNLEDPAMRVRYGRNIYGQSTLLARCLVEAGTRFVTLSWAPDANATWDTHGDNFNKLKKTLLPQFDAACSSLLEDLDAQGSAGANAGVCAGRFRQDSQDQRRCRPGSLEQLLYGNAGGSGNPAGHDFRSERPDGICARGVTSQSRRCDCDDLSPAGYPFDDSDL